MLSAIIVAGGRSTRAGFDKLFAELAGQPLIAHAISAFEHASGVDEIVLVGRDSHLDPLRAVATEFPKVCHIVAGGERRQDSVQHGLNMISKDADFVAIHDAARPLVTPAEIERVFLVAKNEGASALAAPISDTLKIADADGYAIGSLPRENVFAMQTPQIFAREVLLRAYDRIREADITVTDEVSAVQYAGGTVAIVPAQEHNPKITYASDLTIAECILRLRADLTGRQL